LSDAEKRDILALQKQYPRFLLVLNVGGPVELVGLEAVTDILLLSQLGTETGAALADIVLGRANPSGKLSTTWAGWRVHCRAGDFGENEQTRYREGVYVGYRWFDSAGIAPTFPFGFGLGYSDFVLKSLNMHCAGRRVCVSGRLTNGGAMTGRETLQVYVSSPEGVLDQPYQALAAFRKSGQIGPGETAAIDCEFDFAELASYDAARAAWVLEAGDYGVRAGTSSRDTALIGVITVPETIVVRQVKNLFGKPDFTDWKPERRRAAAYDEALPRFTVAAADIPTETADYIYRPPVEPECAASDDAALARICVGLFRPGAGLMDSAVGNSAFSVAGAAGESVPKPAGADVPGLVMADGPAGLRLSRKYFRDEEGVHPLTDAIPESMLAFLPAVARWLLELRAKKPKTPEQAAYQYCTAIPIGTAIAQSWDVAFARLCGDIVGREMERFGVHLWLAPALNIHRSIRCGRNFEYFSEDPVLSGKMAAALTRGVQAHPGRGTTVKHYAANNQEYNRYGSNSRASERAFREIYLKGFGIAVRESQPKALMTSYNLINGVHTAQRRDLIEDILRCEFGFEGIVMTDWVLGLMNSKTNKHPAVQPRMVAAAGGDLFMPGCQADYQDILKGLRSGALVREQLLINATRLCRMARALDQNEDELSN
jgi:beta-glucosidase